MPALQQGIYFPGIAGDYVSTPDAAALDIVGDIDLRCEVILNTPVLDDRTLVAKWTEAGNQRSYELRTDFFFADLVAGRWSADGTAVLSDQSVAPPAGDGGTFHDTARCLRMTVRVADGRQTFWMGPTIDGPFTQPPSGVSEFTIGATSLFSGSAILSIGAINAGALQNLAGFIKRVQVRSGIGLPMPESRTTLQAQGTSTVILDADFTKWPKGSTTMVAATGQTLTLNGFDLTAAQANGFRERGIDTPASNLDLSIDGGGSIPVAQRLYSTSFHGWRHYIIHDMVRRGYLDTIPDPNSLYAHIGQ